MSMHIYYDIYLGYEFIQNYSNELYLKFKNICDELKLNNIKVDHVATGGDDYNINIYGVKLFNINDDFHDYYKLSDIFNIKNNEKEINSAKLFYRKFNNLLDNDIVPEPEIYLVETFR